MLTAAVTVVRFCTTCDGEVPFEQPACLDGHGPGCPEWVCVQCGDALVVGFDLALPGAVPAAERRVA